MATTNATTRTPAIEAFINGGTLELAFSNAKILLLYSDTLNPEILQSALMHGLKQKLVDAAAIARNPDTGRSATIDDKYDAVKEIFDRITSPTGTWNMVRGEGSNNGGSLLIRALVQMTGKTRTDIVVFLEAKTKEQRAALKANPKVAAIIAELQAASSNIDSDELLSELG